MLLSDVHLVEEMARGGFGVDPEPEPERIQPASIDLLLAGEFAVYQDGPHMGYIDASPVSEHANPPMQRFKAEEYQLPPLGFALAHTLECIKLGPEFAARVEGKSTLGRRGLVIHATAGFIDPGFTGHVTLELFNCTRYPILLRAGMRICQLAVVPMSSAVKRPYGSPGLGSHYQGQTGATTPR